MPRALISVSDKRGIVPFAQSLVDLGWEIISTGGTFNALRQGGVPVLAEGGIDVFFEAGDIGAALGHLGRLEAANDAAFV